MISINNIFIEKYIISGTNANNGCLMHLCYKQDIEDRNAEYPSPNDMQWAPISLTNILSATYKLIFFNDESEAIRYARQSLSNFRQVNIVNPKIERITLISKDVEYIDPTFIPRYPENDSSYNESYYNQDTIDSLRHEMDEFKDEIKDALKPLLKSNNDICKEIIDYVEPLVGKVLPKSKCSDAINYLLKEKFKYANMRDTWLSGRVIAKKEFNDKMKEYNLPYKLEIIKKVVPKTQQQKKLMVKEEDKYTIKKLV